MHFFNHILSWSATKDRETGEVYLPINQINFVHPTQKNPPRFLIWSQWEDREFLLLTMTSWPSPNDWHTLKSFNTSELFGREKLFGSSVFCPAALNQEPQDLQYVTKCTSRTLDQRSHVSKPCASGNQHYIQEICAWSSWFPFSRQMD